ncbi:MAG: M20 family metallopeptidase [Synergistaceae bacterium]
MWEKYKDLKDYVVGLRRALHQIPEDGNDLPQTQAFVCAELDKLGIPYKKGTKDSSIVALIEGGKPGKVIALRSDMDALPVTEDTGLPFASKHEGKMHACGHDNHMAMLLGAAKILSENKADIKGTVKLLFQTGEELANGSRLMLADGALSNPEVDAVFGMHIGSILDPNIPAGTVIAVQGPAMASYDKFILDVKGVGCHGSTPEKGVDPVVIASNIILALEAVIAREVASTRPAVITIGKINAGFAYNVIPNEVHIEGTTRSLEEEVRQYLAKRIGEISQSVAKAYGGECKFEMVWGAAPVVNDPEMAKLVADSAAQVVGEEKVMRKRPAPNMAGEDFAYFLMEKPGAYFFLSSANPKVPGSQAPHHNPKFTVDEEVLTSGSGVFVALVENYLNK